jgi:hypothetical protein
MDRQLLWIIRNGAFAIALYFALVERVGWLMYAVGGFVWWLCATAAWTMSDPASPSSTATTDAPLATRTAFDAAVLVAFFSAHWYWTAFAYALACACAAMNEARATSKP